MKVEDFTIKKNRQRPDLMYKYHYVNGGYKYEITTFNSGQTFMATIEVRGHNCYLSEFIEENIPSVELCIEKFNNYHKSCTP